SSESERAMAERMWPGLVEPVTASPVATAAGDGITLSSPTPGASLGFRWTDDPASQWRLYGEPPAPPPGGGRVATGRRHGLAASRSRSRSEGRALRLGGEPCQLLPAALE